MGVQCMDIKKPVEDIHGKNLYEKIKEKTKEKAAIRTITTFKPH